MQHANALLSLWGKITSNDSFLAYIFAMKIHDTNFAEIPAVQIFDTLKERHGLLKDLHIAGFATVNSENQIELQTINLSENQFIGRLMEAWLVRKISDNEHIKARVLSEITMNKFNKKKARCYVPIVTGSVVTRDTPDLCQYYSASDNADIRFIADPEMVKKGEINAGFALVKKTTTPAGLQVKTISSNYVTQVVEPMIRGIYSKVLLMPFPGWNPTKHLTVYDLVRSYLGKFGKANEKYNKSQIAKIYFNLIRPESLFIDTIEICHYQNLAKQVYRQHKEAHFNRTTLLYSFGSMG